MTKRQKLTEIDKKIPIYENQSGAFAVDWLEGETRADLTAGVFT